MDIGKQIAVSTTERERRNSFLATAFQMFLSSALKAISKIDEGGHKLQTSSHKCFGYIMYSMMTIVNNTVLRIL